MKLHLPQRLCRALLVCLSYAAPYSCFVLSTAHAKSTYSEPVYWSDVTNYAGQSLNVHIDQDRLDDYAVNLAGYFTNKGTAVFELETLADSAKCVGTFVLETPEDSADFVGTVLRENIINNSGTMEVVSTAQNGGATAISWDRDTINNSGSMKIVASSQDFVADGIIVGTLNNSGTVEIDVSAPGLEAVGVTGSDISNSGTMAIVASSAKDTEGIRWSNITNEAGGQLSVCVTSMRGGGGINGGSDEHFINHGTAEIVVSTVGYAGGLNRINITNEVGGRLTVRATSEEDADGIQLFGGNQYINKGLTEIEATSPTGGATGVMCDNSSTVNNSGTMTITTKTQTGGVTGVYCGYDDTIINSGTMTIAAEAPDGGWACGISDCGTITNSGTIEIVAASEEETYGVYVQRGTFTNDVGGSLTVRAVSTADEGNTTGFASGFLAEDSRIYNSGKLLVSGDSHGVVLDSSQLYLLHGSTIGDCDREGTLTIISQDFIGLSDDVFVNLGGRGAEQSAVAGGSRVTVDSHLSLSTVALNLADDVRLEMGGDLTIAEDVTLNSNGHKLTVDNGKQVHRVTMGSAVAAEWKGAVAVENENGQLKLTSEVGNTVANGTLEAEHISVESVEGAELVLQDVALTVSGNEMNLANVTVQGDCSFASTTDVLTLNVEGVTFVLDASNSYTMKVEPVSLFSADPLTLQSEVSPSVFYLASDMLEGVNVAGDMTLDFSDWAEEIKTGGYDSIALSFAEDMSFGEGAELKATLDGVNFAVVDYAADNVMNVSVSNLSSGAVPEPTTATLSLLALAALVARRRRK